MSIFNGKKTYATMIAAALTAIGAFIGGEIALAELVTALFSAAGVATLRHGQTTEAKKAKDDA